VPHQLPDWKIGDPVYGLGYDSATGRYVIRGVGRVIRIEPPYLILATKRSGEKRVGMQEWPQFNSRAAAEAYIRDKPGPQTSTLPMAHHTAPAVESQWECLLCLQLADGVAPTVVEHSVRCPKRDPAVKS
jgi:hypothetical protein